MLRSAPRVNLVFPAAPKRFGALSCCACLALSLVFSARAQQPAESSTPPAAEQPAPTSGAAPAAQQAPSTPADQASPASNPNPASAEPGAATAPPPSTPTAPPPAAPAGPPPAAAVPAANAAADAQSGGISEEELRKLVVGKALYLRGGYLDNSLSFDETGRIADHSPEGSYTLSAIEINRVRLKKHKVELEGIRYGLHFVGQLAYEDPSKAVDRVRITPEKKVVKITIDREMVVTPKKHKEPKESKEQDKKEKLSKKTNAAAPVAAATAPTATATVPPATATAPVDEPAELSPADQLKASIAAAPEAERPADPDSVTTTISPAHAAQVLKDALDMIFAQGLDDRMMAAMPDFWKLYYQAVADRADYRPKDPAILRQNTVDQKARLLSTFEPESNEFAQANGVAGMALYHTVIGSDGKAQEIAVGRPIGFGLDENAVAAIRKASFQPAMKDGKPVPVLLDLVVQFRIFSHRTAATSQPDPAAKPAEPVLPGPYSLPHP